MASPRRKWEQLSESYRRRLGRAGMSQRDYERGVNLAAARGHGRTPERPERAYRQPVRYKEYIRKHAPSPGGKTVSGSTVDRLLTAIRDANQRNVYTTVRAEIERQPTLIKIELARQLGIAHSIPQFESLNTQQQLELSELWLRVYMTHARAAVEPMLQGERYIMDSLIGISKYGYEPKAFHDVNVSRREFYLAFRESYTRFFTNGILPGA